MKRSILALAALPLLMLYACADPDSTSGPSESVTFEELVVGSGATAAVGDTVSVHYIGTLTDGTQFDNSYTRGAPYSFRLGAGTVIPGFDQGVVGMRVGGKRRVTIPPSLGYGSQGQGLVPGNATLRFDIELVSIAGK